MNGKKRADMWKGMKLYRGDKRKDGWNEIHPSYYFILMILFYRTAALGSARLQLYSVEWIAKLIQLVQNGILIVANEFRYVCKVLEWIIAERFVNTADAGDVRVVIVAPVCWPFEIKTGIKNGNYHSLTGVSLSPCGAKVRRYRLFCWMLLPRSAAERPSYTEGETRQSSTLPSSSVSSFFPLL